MEDSNDDITNTNQTNHAMAGASSLFSGDQLETGLHSQICCIVCKVVRLGKLYQCFNGHLICAGCYHMRMWDTNLGADVRTCPHCKAKLYLRYPCRNLVAEYLAAEIELTCDTCSKKYKNGYMRQHMLECENRLIQCKYQRLGCPWKGSVKQQHEQCCEMRLKKGAELLQVLRKRQSEIDEMEKHVNSIFHMNCLTELTFQVLPFRKPMSKPFEPMAVTQFEAFACRWSMWLKIEAIGDQLSEQSYQKTDEQLASVMLELRLENTPYLFLSINIKWTLVQSVFCDIKFENNWQEWSFTKNTMTGPAAIIYKNDWKLCLKQMEKGLYARILMADNSNLCEI